MKEFNKRTEIVLLGISVIGLIVGALLIFFSNSLLYLMETFLETKVFHREFDLSKWGDTINALLSFPLFMVIAIDTLLFLKFSDKTKIVLLSLYIITSLFFIAYCSFTRSFQFIDSDMASEILLAEECFLEKSFWPRSWNYSTEIRLLNTQLIAAPLFAFTSSWITVKAISATILSLLLPLSLWFLLHQLGIKKLWVKLLWCLVMLCPWSSEMWRIVQFGNYYIPHISIAFIVLGLYIALSYKDLSQKKYKLFLICYVFLTFVSGLAGIRYILYFLFPLSVTVVGMAVNNWSKSGQQFSFKTFFLDDSSVFLSCLALVLGCVGYIGNTLVLSRLFSFSDFNTTAFTSIGDVTVADVLNGILGILGYKNLVSVFTPSGIINVLLYIGIAFFFLGLLANLKVLFDNSKSFFLLFSVVMFVFNSFIFINTEYIARYFILPLAFIIPCIAVLVQNEKISVIKRYILGSAFVIILLSGSFVTYGTVLCSDNNSSMYPVRDFLISQKYEFGYGTFWNANVFTFLTDGDLRIGNLNKKNNEEGVAIITKKYEWDNWLTPNRYYSHDYGEQPIFLILTQDEYELAKDDTVVLNGMEVYSDDFYKVFEYKNHQAFKDSFTLELSQ